MRARTRVTYGGVNQGAQAASRRAAKRETIVVSDGDEYSYIKRTAFRVRARARVCHQRAVGREKRALIKITNHEQAGAVCLSSRVIFRLIPA